MSFTPFSIKPWRLLISVWVVLLVDIVSGQNGTVRLPLASRPVFQFGANGTWIENIAVRQNGDLLITTALPSGNLFLVQNPTSQQPSMVPLFAFPTNSTAGIVETRPDTFVVLAENISTSDNPANGVQGSNQVWEVTLMNTQDPPEVVARRITEMPDALRLNGAAAVPNTTAVLVGDSELGAVFRLDTATGQYTKAFQFPEMAPVPNSNSSDDALGINGMKAPGDGFLYFSNAASRTMYRTAITADGFPAAGSNGTSNNPVETIARIPSVPWLDDFDVRTSDGSIFLTGSTGNVLLFIKRSGSTYEAPVTVAGDIDQLTLATCTASVFGRSDGMTTSTLFVTTGGAEGAPVNGTVIEPAKVMAIDTSGL
ncbi:hypothetical protein BJ170DRAFT_415851 [Xylariales sp. AK1849]|nr:hypothetical protein BJ170DRAFT_415851 [Xylariales sp. AK1849]